MSNEALLAPTHPLPTPPQGVGSGSGGPSWLDGFGVPSTSGAQGDLRYAYFPDRRRLVIQRGSQVTIFDTGEHRISGVAQQQGKDSSLTFTSQLGRVRLADLPVVGPAPDGRPGK